MNISHKVLHLSLLLAMTVPAMAQTTFDEVQTVDNGMPYSSVLTQWTKARNEMPQRKMLLSEDKLQTQDRLQIQDKLQDQDKLQTRDRDKLQTRNQDRLENQQRIEMQEKHRFQNMLQYEERASGQGFSTGGSMNRRMNGIGSGAAGGGAGHR